MKYWLWFTNVAVWCWQPPSITCWLRQPLYKETPVKLRETPSRSTFNGIHWNFDNVSLTNDFTEILRSVGPKQIWSKYHNWVCLKIVPKKPPPVGHLNEKTMRKSWGTIRYSNMVCWRISALVRWFSQRQTPPWLVREFPASHVWLTGCIRILSTISYRFNVHLNHHIPMVSPLNPKQKTYLG